MARRRLDAELVRRGLAASRDEAEDAVRAVASRWPARRRRRRDAREPEQALAVTGAGRLRLPGWREARAALDGFDVDPTGRDCLDAGASTGGFTDCLLQRAPRAW